MTEYTLAQFRDIAVTEEQKAAYYNELEDARYCLKDQEQYMWFHERPELFLAILRRYSLTKERFWMHELRDAVECGKKWAIEEVNDEIGYNGICDWLKDLDYDDCRLWCDLVKSFDEYCADRANDIVITDEQALDYADGCCRRYNEKGERTN